MYRKIIDKLREWKGSERRKPLVLAGARQVGKTYILRRFGEREYANVAYINCDNNAAVRNLFLPDYNLQRILLAIGALTGQTIKAGQTLIVLDEIQEVPRGLAALKYFYEEAPEYHVAASGSLLGIAMHGGESFPVGKVDVLPLYPMTFDEFLLAKGRAPLVDILKSHDWATAKLLRPEFIRLLREYYLVGGMPEVVSEFIRTNDATTVRRVQGDILYAYRQDFSKHVSATEANRIGQVWQSMPSQLVKENKKFIYGAVKSGGRAKEFEAAIQWLIDAGLVYKSECVSAAKLPLRFYASRTAFKLFLLDCGLLGAMSDTPPAAILLPDNGTEEWKGAFTENYVMSQLVASGISPFYYTNDNKLEIDFLIQHAGVVVPIEAKAEENLRSKSLSTFLAASPALHGLRLSMADYREQERFTNVPLYALSTYFA